jgi:acetyl-CoA synthetase
MLVLKRGYEFWYCMMGLHKIGAIAVQATHMLLAKDYIYRMNAAGSNDRHDRRRRLYRTF